MRYLLNGVDFLSGRILCCTLITCNGKILLFIFVGIFVFCLVMLRWEHKKVKLSETGRIRKKVEADKIAAGEIDEEELAKQRMEQLVLDTMGPLRYYLTPWNRIRTQIKIEKRQAIEANLEKEAAQGILDEEEDINLEITS